MVEVTTQMVVLVGVGVCVALVGSHLWGRMQGRTDQEERYQRFERPEWGAGIARLNGKLQELGEKIVEERRVHEETIKEKEAGAARVIEAMETKYQRMVDEAGEELADANRRVDFFWWYPFHVGVRNDGAPGVIARREPQDRAEFDEALTKILAKEGVRDD
jgi:hypothetical protein